MKGMYEYNVLQNQKDGKGRLKNATITKGLDLSGFDL